MGWKIILFETKRGEKPVEEFIKSLPESTTAKVAHKIDLLEKHGAYLSMPHTKKLTSVLYELRVRGVVEIRIIYVFKSRNIYLLHAFGKKTQKTPVKEIETASRRLNFLTSI